MNDHQFIGLAVYCGALLALAAGLWAVDTWLPVSMEGILDTEPCGECVWFGQESSCQYDAGDPNPLTQRTECSKWESERRKMDGLSG